MLDQEKFNSLFLFDLGFSASLNQQAGTSDFNRLKIFLSTASFIEDSGIVYSFWSSGNLTGIIYSPNSALTRPLTTSLSSGYFTKMLIASRIPTNTPSRKQQIVAVQEFSAALILVA
jgi:hypothetical protein